MEHCLELAWDHVFVPQPMAIEMVEVMVMKLLGLPRVTLMDFLLVIWMDLVWAL